MGRTVDFSPSLGTVAVETADRTKGLLPEVPDFFVDPSAKPVMGPKIFVAIAGNIGTGKTTLTKLLSQKYGWHPHFEVVVNNPYLEDFYGNMARWSFPIQIFFLNSRFKAHRDINLSPNSAIQDRSIYEDANIFARNLYESGHMEKRDYHTYLDLYSEICHYLTPPDLLIYLRKSLPKLKSNIAQRGRAYEATIADDYLGNLNRYYDEWIENYRVGKVLVVDSDNYDFLNRPGDFDSVGSMIFQQLDQQELFLPSK
jgi:deoxyadenosine/deoxycytidine kinase